MSIQQLSETIDLSKLLNGAQLKAALHKEGPMLLIAGAGSGKTRVVTYRIVHLLQQGVDPKEIVAVTFTNKAAKEMRERIGRQGGHSVLVSTFHGLGLSILKERSIEAGLTPGFVIYDQDDSSRLLKSVLKRLEIPEKKCKAKIVKSLISKIKNCSVAIDELEPPEGLQGRLEEVYQLYQAALNQANAVDFDDLLLSTLQLLEQNSNVRAYYQNRWRYLLVDEYQDTNSVQYQLIRLLAGSRANVFVVGDPDQSIYSWRGADISNILSFEKDFPGAQVVALEQNYRSTSLILSAANHLIQNNQGRYEKKLWSDRKEGEKIAVTKCMSDREEADYVADEVERLFCDDQVPYSEQVIFYRTNFQSRAFEDAFIRRAIPYHIIGGISFYDRREIKDILAFIRVALSGADTVSFARTINLPKRGIGEKTVQKWVVGAQELGLPLILYLQQLLQEKKLTSRQCKGVEGYLESLVAIQEAAKIGVVEAVRAAIEKTGYESYLLLDQETAQDRRENLYELCYKAQEWVAQVENPSIHHFLEELSLRGQTDEKANVEQSVSLMTVHNGKGLEFSAAFVVGLEEHLFPHTNAGQDSVAIEEERRLCYVAMTRAKDRLFITHAMQRHLWGAKRAMYPSRFLKEIPEKYVEQNFYYL